MKQQRFSSFEQSQRKKRTKRDVFLAEMGQVVPWVRLEALVSRH
ncbi:Mobile element protein [hydrothermal vent metagenome]|uniref:Mobile element protein n=1 Tax=hydrothermal vent metagenome TaxID=652676 RepID=A0A3B0RIK7_9ZZZZ